MFCVLHQSLFVIKLLPHDGHFSIHTGRYVASDTSDVCFVR